MATSTIVIEDGTGKATANSYATVAQLQQAADDKAIELTGENGDTTQLLYLAMEFLESLSFIGLKKTKAQAKQWPRNHAVIDGFAILSTEIPQALIDAQIAIAISIDEGLSPLATLERGVKSEKIDVLNTVYEDSAAAYDIARRIAPALSKLLRAGSSGNSFQVTN